MARLASLVIESLNLGILIEYLSKPSIEAEKGKEVNMASLEPK